MREITFTSILDCSHQEALEQILFLNRNQEKVSEVALAVDRDETPRISNADNRLWITFDSGLQCSPFSFSNRARKAKARWRGCLHS